MDLGLKSNLAEYKVPREDLPKIAKLAVGGNVELLRDVEKLLETLYSA